jgi:hypothetical protein
MAWEHTMTKTIPAAGLACLLALGTAQAECPRAEPPPAKARPDKPAFPAKPPCLDAKGGCPGWEAYSYNDAIKAYNAQIAVYRPLAEAYVKALNAYVKAASDYAQCEVKALQ